MSSSLSNIIKSLRYKGQITDEQCNVLLNKLKGHDKHLLNNAVNVVRCCECKYYEKADAKHRCQIWQVLKEQASPPPNGYCHCGKKK